MSMDALSLAKDFSIFDPSILSEEDKANQRRFPTPKEFVDSVSVGGGDISLDELGKSYTKHYKDYVTKSVGLSPALADAKALAIQNMFFTGKDNTQFNDVWGSILNPRQAQAKAEQQAQANKGEAGHLDNIARGYYQQSAANFVSSAMRDMEQADSATRVRAGQDWLSNQAANDNSQLVMGGGNQAVDLNNQLSGPLPIDPYGRIAQANESAAVQNIQQAQTQLDKASALPESKGVNEFSKTEGFFDAAGQLIMNPIDTALPLVEQSLAPMASQLGAAAVGGAVGGIPGAMAAGGASSYEVNRAAKILEEAQKTGRPLIDIVRDAQARGDIQGEASRYATIVGAADALSMGAAGATMPARTLLGRAAMQTGLQAGLGGAGEAGGQIAATGEITSGRDIAAEALLEIPFGAAEVGIAALNRPRTQADRTPPNESTNRQGLGTTTVTPQPTQPNANPLSQFVQKPQTANQTNSPPEQPNGLDMNTVVDRMIGAESAGKADAKNPLSSAEGLGQFIDSTWLAMVKKHRPDIASGKSDDAILALKTNGALSREMTTRYAEDNLAELQASGFEATGRNVYLAHHFGVEGASSLLKADPNSPVSTVVSEKVIQQNPYMKGKSVGEVLNVISNKMGEQAGAVSANNTGSGTGRVSAGFQNTTTEPTVQENSQTIPASTPEVQASSSTPPINSEPAQIDTVSPTPMEANQAVDTAKPAANPESVVVNPPPTLDEANRTQAARDNPQSQIIPSTETSSTSATPNSSSNTPDAPSRTTIPSVEIPEVNPSQAAPIQGLPKVGGENATGQGSTATQQGLAASVTTPSADNTPPTSSELAPVAAINIGKKGVISDENNQEQAVDFQVVDVADLSLPEVSTLERKRKGTQRAVDRISRNPIYDLLNTGSPANFDEGAPVLGQDNTVVAGNRRMLGLKGAYAAGRASQYKKSLMSDLKAQGVDTTAISQMKAPVLVRRVQGGVAGVQAAPVNLTTTDPLKVNASLDQTIHQVATDKQISELAEDALLSVFGESPKNQAIADRLLRQFFFDNFVQSETYPDSRSFVTARMNELRSSGALKLISDQYFSGKTAFKLKDDANRKPISPEKAESAIRRILGDLPFETTIPNEIRSSAGDAADRVKGAFANGKIYIDTSNIGSIAEAEALAIEELVHRGVANLFGPDYDARLMALHEAIGGEAGIRRFISQHKIEMADDYFNQSPQAQMDELLAHIEANQSTLTVRVKRAFQRVIAHLRNAIRKLNTKVLHNVSDSDIVLIARNARNAAANNTVSNPSTNTRFHLDPEQAAAAHDFTNIKRLHDERKRRSGRLGRYLKTEYQTWGDRKASVSAGLFKSESAERAAIVRRAKRHLFSDSFLGRDVADAKRGLDWDKAVVSEGVKSDVVALEALIENIYGKHRSELSRDEQEQFHQALTGKIAFPNEAIQRDVNVFRARIDEASQKLIAEKYREMQMRIDELNDEGKAAIAQLAAEWLDPNYQYEEGQPIPKALMQIHRLQMQINTIEGNKGAYLNRSYQAFTDPKWVEKVKRKPVYQEAIQFIQDENNLSQDKAEAALNTWLEGTRGHTNMISFSGLGGTNEGIMKRRKEIPPVLRQVLGEFTDPVYNYANTITQVGAYVAHQQYQMTLRHLLLSMPDIATVGEGSGNKVKQFPKTAAYSVLNDVFVEPAFLDELQEFGIDKPLIDNTFMKLWTSTSAAVKLGKTIGSPTTQMRNFWSGFLLLAQAGHSPFGEFKETYELMLYAKNRVNVFTGDLMLGKQEAMLLNQKYIRLGVRRDGASSGELEKIFNDFHQMDTAVREQGLLSQSFSLLVRSYQFSDDFFKIIHFEKGLADLKKTGMSEVDAELEAARRTRDTMPTYSMVPRWVRNVRQFPAIGSFVAFPYEQLRTLKNNLMYLWGDVQRYRETGNSQWLMMAGKRAMGLAVGFALPSIAASASMWMFGIDDEDDDALDYFGSDWRRGQLRLYLGKGENGMNYLDLTSLVPSEYVLRAVRQAFQKSDETGGGFAGAWAGLWEGALTLGKPYYQWDIATQGFKSVFDNYDSSTGRPIYGEGKSLGDLLGEPGKNQQHWGELFNYVSRQFGPGVVQNLNDFSRALAGTVGEDGESGLFSSLLNEHAAGLGGNVSRSGKEFTQADAVAALLGFRVTTQDVNTLGVMASGQTRSKIAAYSAEFKQALDTTVDLSPEFIDGRIEQVLGDRQRAYEKMQDLIHFYKKKGRGESEIADLLYEKDRSLGKEQVRQLVRGQIPQFEPSKELLSRSLTITDKMANPQARLQAKRALAERYRYVVKRAAEMQRAD